MGLGGSMTNPLVSVITPSFNQASFLPVALESVRAQDYQPIEHLVFDGGSTDGSVEILQNHVPEVRAEIGPDGGQADAVNRGLRAASGEIIGWLNSDDFYYPGAIARAVSHLQAHPECAVVYGAAQYVDPQGQPLDPYPTGDPEDLRYGCFICQPSVFFRRRAIQAVGLLDTSLRYALDYDLWLRMARSLRIDRISDLLAASRLHPAAKSVAEQLAARREAVHVTRRHLGATPLPCLYGYADLRVRQWMGGPVDDRRPAGWAVRAASVAATVLLALRFHPRPTIDDVRLIVRRSRHRRTLRPGDFTPSNWI